MAANVTICIPAYRSEAFIHETLQSVLAQTYPDFVVDIAVEPPAEETLDACAPFLRDDRIRATVNPELLGWAENMRSLVRRVATPYFFILPHDDLLQPDYIATLLAELESRPHASIAYSDIACFGHQSFRLRISLTEEPIFDRLMSYFLGGMEAHPMRALTRASARGDADFPTDRYGGFAVECEWVLHLLLSGAAVHVPRPLYLKRTFGSDRASASQQRLLGRSGEHLIEALEDHRARMLALVRQPDLPIAMRYVVEVAAEAAVLRRHMTFDMGAFLPSQRSRADHLLTAAAAIPEPYGKRIQAMVLAAMSQHSSISGDPNSALDLAVAAVDADPYQWEAVAHLGRLQLKADRSVDALATARRAWAVEPNGRGLRELVADCENAIESAFLAEMMRSGRPEVLAERFDAAGYLADHPDVAAAGIDPWQHYREYGCLEGRKVRVLPIETGR